ncbi:hypothetical protein B5X24_HaOG212757 [Helicoverpa armigera]|uniref:Uncharacterized protein n=1 Tax=Helicoverpa armigera TaxID=29058 RepID=A0A2W1BEJ1_HELAM|nr:hypothetical protein B5X24_HaOG212757 [Helicoverpa armigera]
MYVYAWAHHVVITIHHIIGEHQNYVSVLKILELGGRILLFLKNCFFFTLDPLGRHLWSRWEQADNPRSLPNKRVHE